MAALGKVVKAVHTGPEALARGVGRGLSPVDGLLLPMRQPRAHRGGVSPAAARAGEGCLAALEAALKNASNVSLLSRPLWDPF